MTFPRLRVPKGHSESSSHSGPAAFNSLSASGSRHSWGAGGLPPQGSPACARSTAPWAFQAVSPWALHAHLTSQGRDWALLSFTPQGFRCVARAETPSHLPLCTGGETDWGAQGSVLLTERWPILWQTWLSLKEDSAECLWGWNWVQVVLPLPCCYAVFLEQRVLPRLRAISTERSQSLSLVSMGTIAPKGSRSLHGLAWRRFQGPGNTAHPVLIPRVKGLRQVWVTTSSPSPCGWWGGVGSQDGSFGSTVPASVLTQPSHLGNPGQQTPQPLPQGSGRTSPPERSQKRQE